MQRGAMNVTTSGNKRPPSERTSKSAIFFYFAQSFFFGIDILLFVIGILYLSVYYYAFSFAAFSTTVIASIFIAFSVVLAGLVFLNAFAMHNNMQLLLVICSLLSVLLLIALFAVGLWGCVDSSDERLERELRANILTAIKAYNVISSSGSEYANRAVDWLQSRFDCCGLDAYTDWRAIYLYGNGNGQLDQSAIRNNYPYYQSVPDSCCLAVSVNCGSDNSLMQSYRHHHNWYDNRNHAEMFINTKGCAATFQAVFARDIRFLAILCITTSAVCILLWIVLVVLGLIARARS